MALGGSHLPRVDGKDLQPRRDMIISPAVMFML